MVSRREFLFERLSVIAPWKGKEIELKTRRLILTRDYDNHGVEKKRLRIADVWMGIEMGLKIMHEHHEVGQALDAEMMDVAL